MAGFEHGRLNLFLLIERRLSGFLGYFPDLLVVPSKRSG